MKKGKVFLAVTCGLVLATGVFAFKANQKSASPNIFLHSAGTYTLKVTCYFPKEPLQTDCGTINNSASDYYYLIGSTYEPLPTGTAVEVYTVPAE